MTERELIELMELRSPEELSVEEVEALRAALPGSPELQRVLAEHLEMERYLRGALGRVRVSAERIMGASDPRRDRATGWRASRRWMVMLLILVGAGVAIAVWSIRGRKAAERSPMNIAVKSPAAKPVEHRVVESLKSATAPKLAAVAVVKPSEAAPKPVAVAPPVPRIPVVLPKVGVMDPGTAMAVYPGNGHRDWRAASLAEVEPWLTPIAGRGELESSDRKKVSEAHFRGLLHVKMPEAGRALRIGVRDSSDFAVDFWNGGSGVRLLFHWQGHSLTAYRVHRKRGEYEPDRMAVLGNDQQRLSRAIRGGVSATLRSVDLRWESGRLIVSRADAAVLSVPMPQRPGEVVLDTLGNTEQLGRLVDVPAVKIDEGDAAPSPLRVIDRPADLAWMGNQPTGAKVERLDDGAVRVSMQGGGKEVAWAGARVRRDTLCDIVLELDELTAGTGVYVGDAEDDVRFPVTIYREQSTGRLMVGRWTGEHQEDRPMWRSHSSENPPLYVGDHAWVRLVLSGGELRYWVSGDGVTWAQAPVPGKRVHGTRHSHRPHHYGGDFQIVGIYCLPGNGPRAIRLRSITLRQYAALASVAPAELVKGAPSPDLDRETGYDRWLEAVVESKPAGVDAADWAAACAVRSLSDGSVGEAGRELVEKLVEAGLNQDRPIAAKLAMLDQAAVWYPQCDDGGARRFCGYYEELAEVAAAGGEVQPWTRIGREALRSPVWTRDSFTLDQESLVRGEVLGLASRGMWPELYELCRRVRFMWRERTPEVVGWAESLAAGPLGQEVVTNSTPFLSVWRSPVVLEVSKEGFSDNYDLQTALEHKAYADACRTITRASVGGGGGGDGLLPHPADASWMLSWGTQVRMALRGSPELARVMRQRMSEEGRLRVRQATDTGDAAAVRAAAIHYWGTPGAAEAELWLGDRALGEGEAATAIGCYRRAMTMAEGAVKGRIEASLRVAQAMLGEGGAVAQDAVIGETRVPAAELEALRQRRAAEGADSRGLRETPFVPGPSGLEAVTRGRYEGEVGDHPENSPYRPIDLAQQQLAWTLDGNRLLMSNRFQVASHDAGNLSLQWRTALSHDAGQKQMPAWTYARMNDAAKPVAIGGRVFVRRLAVAGSDQPAAMTLACLDEGTGRVIWTTPTDPNTQAVADPIVVQQQAWVLEARNVDGREWVLTLSRYDPQTGELLGEKPLVALADHWGDCGGVTWAAVDDGFVAQVLGTVIAFDLRGSLRWARRELFVPQQADNAAGQWITPPLVRGEVCYVTGPHVRAVSCIEVGTGRLRWRRVLSGVQKLVGVTGGRVVVLCRGEVVGLGEADGKVDWRCETPMLAAAPVCGESGGIVYVRSLDVGKNQRMPDVVWLDPTTGRMTGHAPLESLTHRNLQVGPLMAEGKRLLLMAGWPGDPNRDLTREIVELVAKGEAQPGAVRGVAGGEAERWSTWAGIDAAEAAGLERALPGWRVVYGQRDPQAGPLDFAGEKGAVQVRLPLHLVKRVEVPAGKPRLVVRVASRVGTTWRVGVRSPERGYLDQQIDPGTTGGTGGGWKDFTADLTPIAGQRVWVTLELDPRQGEPLGRIAGVRIEK